MSAHLEGDALEAAARGEANAHLDGCAECRQRVADARGRQRLLGGLTPYTLSDLAFRRVEARLTEAVDQGELQPHGLRWWWWLAGAAVAALLAFVLVPGEAQGPNVVTLPRPQPVLAQALFRPLTVVRATDARARQGAAEWRALSAGDVVDTGDGLALGRATLASADGRAWHLEASGAMSLGGAASVTLGAGEVKADVVEPFHALASSRRVLAADARFSLSRTGAEVVLEVARGAVEVVDTLTAERRVVKAPARLRWSDGSGLGSGLAEVPRGLALGALPAPPWVRFDTANLPGGTQVSLDGALLGAAPFVELVTAGRRRLALGPPEGARLESWVDLVGGQPFVASAELAQPAAEGPPPDPEALARLQVELKRQVPKLAACYEKWLKADPSAQGEVTLELVVGRKGQVRRATVVQGATISPGSVECLKTTARSLVLPPLGGEVTLELPLVLRQPAR